jgi:hypothetical protein
MCEDDTGVPIRCRINRFDFDRVGAKAMANLVAGEDDLLVRGDRVEGYYMIRVRRIRCLNSPGALDA